MHDVTLPFVDRAAAGKALARLLLAYRGRPEVIVLALPRGGVPVGYEVASELGVELDLMIVRKLGVPWYPELAMGAIASGGVRVLNDDVLRMHGVDAHALETVERRESAELHRRERAYRGQRPVPTLAGRQVLLVDDGLATGATMLAAVRAVRQQVPAAIVVAVPVAPAEVLEELRHEVDEVVCPFTPEPFSAIGRWYLDFSQTSDAEVVELLQRAWRREAGEA
ncbi:phosphoribosyltransferase [Pseudomonas citronellolis]|uniref:phosphoribosyltransferase n=1 Tax=Pseudomonas citronellolis TaxID=53408 RepID=UPI000718407F|nr:phosphoribosyltransferase [Pseudomonas citronellolis]KRV69858.1 phosphoribosyl transferase [Pseudomonas citronellolis]KRW77840.1 phosphoribosyl transferase [Pseudomonas citronellolis]